MTDKERINLGFILKKTVMEVSKELNDSDFRELITALFNYAVCGEEVELTNSLSKAIFLMEKPSIDRNNEKWEQRAIAYNRKNSLGYAD